MISEGYTNKNSFAYQLDPRVKIVAVFFFSVIVAVSNRFVALSAALTLALCAVMLAKVSPKEFVRRLIPVNIFILFLWIFLPFSTQGKPLLAIAGLVATYEGVTYAAQITIKSNAIMAALIVLISSTPILTLGHALHELKVPQKLIHLFFFTYRYIHVIHREYLRLLNAMKVRAFNPGTNMHTFWHRAHLMPNGDLLAIFDGIGIVKLDKQSNVLWQNRNGAHHDLYVAENGDIYLLTRRTAINPKHNPVEPILEEFITVLDPGGSELRDFSVFDALRNSPFRSILGRLAAKGDIFHTNTIELVESAPGHHESPFRAGSVLISVRQLSLVCAVDMDTEIVYWAESDRWQLQHQPTLLENGNMLIFDNFRTSDTSAVVEFDPTLSREEWSYVGDIDGKFFSPACGSCQRLPNGNTLITESDPGRAFEVTPDKEMVWEYVNPQRAGDEGELIATLFEIIRLPRDVMSDWSR